MQEQLTCGVQAEGQFGETRHSAVHQNQPLFVAGERRCHARVPQEGVTSAGASQPASLRLPEVAPQAQPLPDGPRAAYDTRALICACACAASWSAPRNRRAQALVRGKRAGTA